MKTSTSQLKKNEMSSNDLVESLIREELKSLKPYESARRLFSMSGSDDLDTIWLNANENPYSPEVSADPSLYNRYPDFQPEPLINAYASYAQVSTDQVLATRGADEGIELLIRTFCSAGQNILICPPTYGMYAISAETAGVNVLKVPLLEVDSGQTVTFKLDVSSVVEQANNAQIVFICSPNNPTGDIMDKDDLIAVLNATKEKSIVVADEAYIEFCSEATVVDLLSEYPNLVILRTLSKAFALAGLRCGFTLSSASIIDALKKVIAPYPIPAPVAQMATQALSNKGLAWMQTRVTELNNRRDAFIEEAQQWSFAQTVYPSKTNFVLIKLSKLSADFVMNTFIKKHILLRNQSKQLLLNDTIRVTIGSEAEMNAVIDVFTQLESTLD
ncbi:histidinol-phosphate transaminase [Psychrosphaera aestuarii]|uniref:histidinol-phosphate transaminase n=1 Tax=Psychrosphaera aestuarii TaxID=1266052 RepID=UPI001FCFC718|nr:histidinol-phosphate transaminase [Psychrosphaera aestuarii]